MFRFLIKKLCRPDIISAPLMAALFFCASVSAMVPPAGGELEKYVQDGSFARRAEFANALGNNRAAPRQLSKMSVSLSKNTVESAPPPALRGVPTSGNVRPVVLLIDFIDATHTISSAAVANGLFGTSGGAYGSLRNYYYNSSYGKLELSGGLVLGWQKLLMRRSSVAGTKAERENIIKTALANYAGSVDFSQYDSDGDGYVDDLIVVWSGDNGGWGDFWWSYTDTIVDASFTYNGVKFRNYSWQWEKYGTAQFDVMTATRLMANSLGIPDYYDYAPGVGPNGGLGGIDIMDSLITHTPRVDHNAFSKMLLGWLEPQAFNSGSSAVSLGSVETSSSAAQLLPAGGVSSVFGEYFLIENRQNGTGNDLDLPGSGLLIWHVNAALNTAGSDFLNDNSRTDQKLLKLMQADGQGHIEQSLYAQANDFYKVGGHFGAGTNPNSSLYSGLPTSADVSAISGANPMAFTVAYSAPPGEIANLSAAEVTGTIGSVRLDWTQPANASRYEIRYSTIGEPGGSAVPWDSAQVWTSTKTASSVTETEYAGALYLPETFYFKVKAYNADGSFVFSNAASVRPWDAPPSAPDSVYADDQIKTENGLGGDGMAYINWTAPGEDGDYGDIKLGAYRFAVSTDPAVSWDVDVYNDSGTIHDIVPGDNYAFAYNGLMPDVTYYLALWIQDEGGNWSLPAVENMGYFKDYVPAVPVLTGEPMNRAIKFSWALKEADIDYCALWISTYAPFFVQNSSGNINQLLISSISMPTSSYIGTVPAGAGGNYRLYCYDNKPDGAPDVPYVKYSTSNVLQIYATDLEAPLVRNLRSTTHPSEDVVYANNLPQFFWDASDTGGQGLQNIFVSLSATSTLTADQVGQFTLGPNISSYTYTAPLTEGDWYFYVVAQDKAGNKSEAVKRKIRVDWYPNQPGTPSIAVASGKLTITWTPPSPVPADLDYYELYCDSVTADDWSDSFLLARSTGTSFIHDNLDVLTTYYYRVVAVDKGPLVLKSSPTLDAMARPLGVVEIGSINSPTHPSHTAWSGNNLPSFSWTVNDMDRNGIASYYLLLSTSEVTGSVLMSTGIAQTFSTYTAPSPIADGEWAFYLMARDNLGNLTSVAKYAFLVDASTPVAPAGLSAAQEQNSILVSWTTPAMAYDISYYKLFCDSTTPYDFSDAFEVASVTTTYYLHTGLENNQPYLYRLYAVDRQGHRSDYSGILNTYPIDATGPVISSVTSPTHPVADLWYPSPSPTFSWSASDSGGAGIKGYYYLLNQLVDVTTEVIKAQGFYTSDTSVSLSGLTDGLWYFHIFAEDQQGNQSRLVSRETRIDYAPGAPRNLNLVARERKITLLWDPPEFVPSDLEKYRIYCDSVSPYGFSEGFILAQTTSTRFEHLNLDSSSTYYYWVTALDTAPNILESEFSNGVAGRPVNSIAIYNVVSPTHPSTSTWYANALPEFSWQVEGNGGLGVSAYYVAVTTYSVSSAAVLAEGVKLTTTSYTVPTALADGAWRFQVISEDALNDHSDMVVYPFKVDAASPPAPLHLLAVSSQNAISLTWDAPVFTYDVDRYEVFCDSVSPFDFSDAFLVVTTTETNYLHTGLINNKSYHYRVYAVDGTGHVGNYADTANNAPLDIISPTVSGLASSSHPDRTFWYQDDSPQFAWSASDGGGSGINGYYYAYSDAETMARQVLLATGVFTSSSGVALSGVPDGFWYFHVMAVDNQGNMSEVNSLPFRIDYFPAPPANVALEKWNGQIKVSWTAPDPDPGDIAFYRVYCDSTTPYDWEDSFILAQVSTFSYMHVDLNEHNTYYYRVTAVDNDPNILESVYSDAVSGVPVDATPPVVTALDSPSHPFENVWYQNSSATFTWGATDSGGAGFKGYYYLLNQSSSVTTGGLLAAGEFTYSTSTSYAGPLADGSWYMHVLGVDNFNNAGSVRNRRININFPPTAPRNLVMSTDVTHVTLTWDPPDPALTDFGYYKVFCDSSTPYDWGDAYLATSTVDAVFIDTVTTYSTRRYRVSVVDSQPTPLESGYSNDIMLEGTSASVNVISPTHPSHTVWSGNNTPSFNWTVSGFDGSSASNYYLMLSTRTVLQAELLASGIAQTESTYTVTVPLADGEWGLYIIARDNLQRFTAVAKYVFLVDVSTPVVPAGFSATQAQNSILLSWDEPYKTYDVAYYRLFCDSTTPYDFADAFEVADTTATSYLHTGLSNYQPYAYRFYVVDRNNNRSDFSGILNTYPVDALLPVISSVTSVTHPVPGVWYPNPSPAYSWTANDGGGAGLKGYYYILNQRVEMTAAEIKAQGVYTSDTEVSYSDLVDGVWYFHLIAEDQQGNQSLPFRYETRIDYAPGAPRNLNLAARNNKIILLWEPPAVVPPDFDVYRIYCDSTSPYNFVDGFILAQTTSTRFDHVNLSSSATYAYQLTGLDVAPNILESGFSNIMSARPISSIAISSIASPTHPSSSTWYAGALPSFSWQVEGNGGIGVSSYYVYLSTFAVSSGTVLASGVKLTTTSYTVPAALADGEWLFQVLSEDVLNDHSPLAVYPFKIDRSSPPAPPHLLAVSSQNAVSLSWDIPVFTYDVDHYEVFCDSVSPYDFSDAFLVVNTTSTNYIHTDLVNYRPYHYRVFAVDKNGRRGSFADTANNAPIDITPPVISGLVSDSHPDPDFWYQDNSPRFNWFARDDGGSGINGYYYVYNTQSQMTAQEIIYAGVFTSSAGVVLSGVPDGFWYFHVMTVDNQGNMSAALDKPFRVDYFPAPPENVTLEKWNGQIKISWTAPDPNPGDIDIYRVYCDSSTPHDWNNSFIVAQTSTLSFTHNDLNVHNTYYYRVTVVDAGPNVLESTYSASVSGLPLDSIAPVMVSLDSPSHPFAASWYENNRPTFTWVATDAGGSGLKGFYYQLNQLEFMTTGQLLLDGDFIYANTTNYSAPVADGVWYAHVMPADYQSNIGNMLDRRININFPPSAPGNLLMSTDTARVTLTWSAPSPMPADFGYYKVYCDSNTPYDWADAFVATATVQTIFIDTVTTYSSYKYRVSVVDSQTSPLESTYSNEQFLVRTDTQVPALVSVHSPTHPDQAVWYTTATPKMEFSAVDYGGSGVKGYYYMWSSSASITQAQMLAEGVLMQATYYHEIFNRDDGEWYFHVMAVDYMLNLSGVMSYRVRIDNPPPTPNRLAAVAGQNQISLSWETMSALPRDFSSFVVYCDSMSFDWTQQFVATETANSSYVHGGLVNYKVYRYRIVSKDRRGNMSDISEGISLFPVDSTLPEITNLVSPTHPNQAVWYQNKLPQYVWHGSDAGGSGLKGYYYLLNQSAASSAGALAAQGLFTIATGYAVTDPLVDGIWYFHIAAVDQQGNFSAVATYQANIDEQPPAPGTLVGFPRDGAVELQWSAPDPYPADFAFYRVYIDSTAPYDWADAFVIQTDSAAYTHWNLDRSATYYYEVRAVDLSPNMMESVPSNVVSVRPVEHVPPVIGSLASGSHPSSSLWLALNTFTVEWSATDEGGSGLAYYRYCVSTTVSTLPELAGGTIITTGTVTLAGLRDGQWYFSVIAVDGEGNLSEPEVLGFKIDTTAPSAAILLAGSSSVGNGAHTVSVILDTGTSPLDGAPSLSFAPPSASTVSVPLSFVSGSTWTGTFFIESDMPSGAAQFSFRAVDSAGNTGTAIVSGGSFTINTVISSATAVVVLKPDNSRVELPAGFWDKDINVRIAQASGADPILQSANAAAGDNGKMRIIDGANLYRDFSATETVSGVNVSVFSKPAKISIGYPDSDGDGVVDGMVVKAEELRMFYLNRAEAKWELVPGQYLEKSALRVSAPVSHFSTYGLLATQSGAVSAAGIVAYPNPCYLKKSAYIAVGGIPALANLTVRVYDQNGVLVRTLTEATGEITASAGVKEARWNGLNSSGEKVASGIYIYLIKADGLNSTGRIGVLW